ncbi:hypothetical protein [Deinococcus sp. UYEF24]
MQYPPLFGSDTEWRHNAVLNYNADDWRTYAEGYRQAAEIIVERMMNDVGLLDTLIYPAVFLYRQFVELSLKRLYREACKIENIKYELQPNHNLNFAWNRLRPVIEKISLESDSPLEDLDKCEKFIKEFSETDPGSFAFRYPTGKLEDKSLISLTHINVGNFKDLMSIVEEVINQLTILTDYVGEYQSDLNSYI